MAQQTFNNGDTGAVVRTVITENFSELYSGTILKGTSPANGLYPGQSLHFIPPRTAGTPPVEFLNLGKLGSINYGVSPNQELINVPKGFVSLAWSQNWVNNWQWDAVNNRAKPYDVTRPMISTEIGGEAMIDHWIKPGDNGSDFHEINRRGGGIDGLSGHDQYTSVVPFNQFKTCIYAGYSSSTVPGAATDEKWWGGSGNTLNGRLNPLLWLHSEEAKGSDNMYSLLETTASSTSAWPAQYFAKSRGTYQTKTAVVADDIGGKIGWQYWDGDSYELTSVIQSVAKGTIANGNAGSSLQFLTSANNAAGLTKLLELMDGSQIGFFGVTPAVRQVVPTGSTADQIITGLQNLGLFSQT